MPDTEVKTIATTIHGRYLVERNDASSRSPIFVGFHGYGQTAPDMLDPLRRIAPPGSTLVSVQALHRFYSRSSMEVVANWMTREDRDLMISDNVEYVSRVVTDIKRELAGGAGPLIYVGFSQGVAMAWRALASSGHRAAALIALGGDLPPDVDDASLASAPRVLIGRGTTEEWYSSEKMESDLKRLSDARVRFEAKIYAGGHEWTEEFFATCQAFVKSALAGEQPGESSV